MKLPVLPWALTLPVWTPWSCTLAATWLSSTERSPPVLPMPITRTRFPRNSCPSLYSRLCRHCPLKRLSMPRHRAGSISYCQMHLLRSPNLPLPPLLAAEKPMEVCCTSSAQSCFANPNRKACLHLYKVFFLISPPFPWGQELQCGSFMAVSSHIQRSPRPAKKGHKLSPTHTPWGFWMVPTAWIWVCRGKYNRGTPGCWDRAYLGKKPTASRAPGNGQCKP